MQFAYQYPDRVERLVLVGSGGAGPEVTPLLRAASLPGAQLAMAALRLPGRAPAGRESVAEALRLLGGDLGVDAREVLRVIDALPDATARSAFLRTLRAVVDWRGQVVTMLDRCYLTRGMPTLLVWGERDAVVPVEHARRAHDAMPGSRLEIFERTRATSRSTPTRPASCAGRRVRRLHQARPRGAASSGASCCAASRPGPGPGENGAERSAT